LNGFFSRGAAEHAEIGARTREEATTSAELFAFPLRVSAISA